MSGTTRKGWVILPKNINGVPWFCVPSFSDSPKFNRSKDGLVLAGVDDPYGEDRYIKVWNVRRSAETFRRSFVDADEWVVAKVDVSLVRIGR